MPVIDRCAAPGQLTLEQALDRLREGVKPLDSIEWVSLQAARGRILAETLHSALDLPPFRSSAMDGYALHSEDLAGGGDLPIAGVSSAGHPYREELAAGTCIRVLTGAVLPEGTAAVIPQEDVQRKGERICFERSVAAGDFVRPRGEDLRSGEPLLSAGKRLEPADLGLLAASGRHEVPVRSRPRVGFLATGDELRPTWEPLATGEIHDSNRYLLGAALEELGAVPVDLGIVADEPEALAGVLAEAATRCDALVTTGGASVGDADHLVKVVQAIGHLEFWRVAIKPGRPFVFGRIGDSPLLGLAGNPVAVAITFRQLVRPALLRLMGAQPVETLRLSARALGRLRKAPGRLEFQRGSYRRTAAGELEVTGLEGQGAHRLATLSRANCLIVLPLECAGIEPGQRVDIELLDFPVP